MKISLFLLLIVSIGTVHAQLTKKDLLGMIRIHPSQMEAKAGIDQQLKETDHLTNLKLGISEVLAEPYGAHFKRRIRNLLAHPQNYGLSYDAYTIYLIEKDSLISYVIVLDVHNYDTLVSKLETVLDAQFEQKGEVLTMNNVFFVDQKKLVIVGTEFGPSQNRKEVIYVNSPDEAKEEYSNYMTRSEQEKLTNIPFEFRKVIREGYQKKMIDMRLQEGYQGPTSPKKDSPKTIEEVIEPPTTTPSTQNTQEVEEVEIEVEGYGSYRSVPYQKPFILIDNLSLANHFFESWTLKGSSALTRFNGSTADAVLWVNGGEGIQRIKTLLSAELNQELVQFSRGDNRPTPVKYLKDLQVFAEINSLNGKSVLDYALYPSADLMKEMKKIKKGKISKILVNYIPKQAVATYLSSINSNELVNLYEKLYTELLSDVVLLSQIPKDLIPLSKMIIDQEAIADFMTGETVLFVDGSHQVNEFERVYLNNAADHSNRWKDTIEVHSRPSVFFLLGTKDQKSWKHLLNLVMLSTFVTEQNGIYTVYDEPYFRRIQQTTNKEGAVTGSDEKFKIDLFFTLVKGAVIFSNDEAKLTQMRENGPTHKNKKLHQLMGDYGVYAQVDIQKTFPYFEDELGAKERLVLNSLADFKFLEMKMGHSVGDHLESSISLSSYESSRNMLRQLAAILEMMD